MYFSETLKPEVTLFHLKKSDSEVKTFGEREPHTDIVILKREAGVEEFSVVNSYDICIFYPARPSPHPRHSLVSPDSQNSDCNKN